jgi:hypothetical protein
MPVGPMPAGRQCPVGSLASSPADWPASSAADWPVSDGYAARRSPTGASARSSVTQAPTSSNARIRLRGDGIYAVK